jgi:2-phospho-L-lactate/phosphoenolpyruvate guanylyltransferase
LPVVLPVQWGLVVPVKPLVRAKTRLSPYDAATRADLALAFAADVVAAGLSCDLVARVLVVTDDPRAAEVLGRLGAQVGADDPDAGLNPALAHGAELLRSHDDSLGVAAVSADLPALRGLHLAAVLGQVAVGERGFVADTAGSGTTVLAAGPGASLLPDYGPGSAERHRLSGARPLAAEAGLRRDVDTPADLAAAVRLGLGPHTAAVVARLP